MNRKTLRNLLRLLSGVPFAYTAVAFLAARRVTVRGGACRPYLRDGDRVLFDRLAYERGGPERGDIVLAVHPSRPGIRIIKRAGGAPGDTVAIEGNRCWVNGSGIGHLPGSRAGDARRGEPWSPRNTSWPATTWTFSTDSRELGPITAGGYPGGGVGWCTGRRIACGGCRAGVPGLRPEQALDSAAELVGDPAEGRA